MEDPRILSAHSNSLTNSLLSPTDFLYERTHAQTKTMVQFRDSHHIKNPRNIPSTDNITDSQVRGSFPRLLSMSEDQNVMIKPPTKPSGNTGLRLILNHRKDTRKDISTQP
jgi:hypothetical protein